ncbi:hypothetical protein TRFO_02188 [Tritrichomonas foetus]|uniref:Uncharacterized protein n=1 Tax=Tritrichomonas foetus TaxID=1144522 RepID=A0A1J4JCT7_9EUKA|nr:hypothetical protein TRFO_02188 [Tritrichomonas foetus]|eukprot:OHS95221.1 hypothetical protein TRFO_02188 [Tritrichomonas foetus]
MKKRSIDKLLDESCDATEIMNSIMQKFNIPKEQKAPKVVPHKSKYRDSKDTQTELSNDQLATECISNWIFGQSPDLHELPADLSISESSSHEIHEDPKIGHGVDDGSFLSDPVLRILRKRLHEIEKSK